MFSPIDDDLTKFGSLVSVELFTQLADNINYLIDSMPVGSIIPIMEGLAGVPIPDSEIWQICDGAMITNTRSPLRGHPAPNYFDQGRYMKGYTNIGDVGTYGGGNVKDLSHSHGGNTGENPAMEDNADTDNDFWTGKNHTHTISPSLGFVNFEPAHYRVNHYIKINDCNTPLAGKFKDLEKDFSTSIAKALWLKAAKAINSLDKSYPLGMLCFAYTTQGGLPSLPSPQNWKLCTGGAITDTNSPLNGTLLPDLSHLFIRHPNVVEDALTFGGQDSVTLGHDHGGATGVTNDRNDFQMDNGGDHAEADSHYHTIANDLVGPFSTIPPFVELQIYIRII